MKNILKTITLFSILGLFGCNGQDAEKNDSELMNETENSEASDIMNTLKEKMKKSDSTFNSNFNKIDSSLNQIDIKLDKAGPSDSLKELKKQGYKIKVVEG